MDESAVHRSGDNSCNLVGVYGAVREQGCTKRVRVRQKDRNGKSKSMETKRTAYDVGLVRKMNVGRK